MHFEVYVPIMQGPLEHGHRISRGLSGDIISLNGMSGPSPFALPYQSCLGPTETQLSQIFPSNHPLSLVNCRLRLDDVICQRE
mmetsp:Transcript_999/g.2135  ORF Transcript_999/g.2135 Transcript_999/m.2135 type:complete len:83 (-) Transcript_999:14-262(-)